MTPKTIRPYITLMINQVHYFAFTQADLNDGLCNLQVSQRALRGQQLLATSGDSTSTGQGTSAGGGGPA